MISDAELKQLAEYPGGTLSNDVMTILCTLGTMAAFKTLMEGNPEDRDGALTLLLLFAMSRIDKLQERVKKLEAQ